MYRWGANTASTDFKHRTNCVCGYLILFPNSWVSVEGLISALAWCPQCWGREEVSILGCISLWSNLQSQWSFISCWQVKWGQVKGEEEKVRGVTHANELVLFISQFVNRLFWQVEFYYQNLFGSLLERCLRPIRQSSAFLCWIDVHLPARIKVDCSLLSVSGRQMWCLKVASESRVEFFCVSECLWRIRGRVRCVCQDGKVCRVDVKRCYLHSIHRMQPFCFFSFVISKNEALLLYKYKYILYIKKTPEGMNVRNV